MGDMSYMFFNSDYFNFDISGWDVTAVDNMKYMFFNTASFNQNMCGWNDQYQGSSNNLCSVEVVALFKTSLSQKTGVSNAKTKNIILCIVLSCGKEFGNCICFSKM